MYSMYSVMMTVIQRSDSSIDYYITTMATNDHITHIRTHIRSTLILAHMREHEYESE